MAGQIIPSRDGQTATLISDSYGASKSFGPATPAEDPTKHTVEWWDTAFLCKRYDCTVDDLMQWSGDDPLSLPKAVQFTVTTFGGHKTVYKRPADKVREWEARLRNVAARLPKR
jgi:hypothetical protein